MISGPRLPYAMATHGQLPSFLAATHPRFHTPHLSILLMAGIVLVVTLQGSFIAALTMSTIVRLVAYAASCAALPALRRRDREAARDVGTASGDVVAAPGIRVPGGTLVAGASLILCAWLLSAGAWRESVSAAIAAALGLVLHGAYRWSVGREARASRG